MSRIVLSFPDITFDFQVENIPSVETSQLLLGAITANGKIIKVKDDKDKGKDKDKDKENTSEDGGTATEKQMNKTEEKDEKNNTKICEGENKEKDQDKETSKQLLISHAAAIEAKKMIARYHCTPLTAHCKLLYSVHYKLYTVH